MTETTPTTSESDRERTDRQRPVPSDGQADTARESDGMPEAPTVSYIVATYNRPDDLTEALESILAQSYEDIEVVVVSNSTEPATALFEDGGRFDRPAVQYHHYPERMGVPRARNVGYEHASGDILVTLDDDAVLAEESATESIVSLFRDHPDVGVLAFQCRNYHTDEINLHETPDPPAFDMTPRRRYRATNFVGVGNAIRASVLEAVGAFPEEFVYGFEEMDLSLRIHDTGYDILYVPEIAVYHKKSPDGRIADTETQERLVENRLRIAVRNLPWRYVLCSTLLWSIYGLALTRQPASLANIYRRLWADREDLSESRSVVTDRTISRIKSRKTMLYGWWYGPHPGRILGESGNRQRLTWET